MLRDLYDAEFWYYLRRSNKGVGDLLRRALLEDVRSLQLQEAAAGDWAGRLYVCEHSYLSGRAVRLRRAKRRGGQAAAHLADSRAAHLPGATFNGRHRDFRKCAKASETTGDDRLRAGGMSQVSSTDSSTFALKRNKTTPRTQKTSPASSTFICKYCGRNQKHRSKEDCTAWGKKCKKNDKPNHFAAVCKSSTSKVGYSNMRGTSQGAKTHVAAVVADEVACLDSLVGFASTQAGAPKLLDGTIDRKKVRWLVDSGSPSTLLSLKCAQELGLQWSQVTGSDTLKSATGSELVEVGRVNCSLSISGHSFTVPVRVIENLSFGAILGRDSLSNLSQVTLKTSNSGPHIVLAAHSEMAGVAEILKEYEDVFDKSLQDSKLNIEPEPIIDLTDDAVPIRSPSRR